MGTVLVLGLLSALIALAMVWFQYELTDKNKRRANLWFALLRFLTLFALLMLIVNPQLVQEKTYIEKPSLILAVDNSASIAYLEQEKEVQNFVSTLQKNKALQDKFELQTYTFGQDFKRGNSFTFTEKQTNIARVFKHLEKIYSAERKTPVVLITDGNQNFGEDFRYVAKNYAQPIIPVVVGDTTQYVDLVLSKINTNPYAFYQHKFPVEVFLNYTGEKRQVTTLALLKNGKTIAQEKFTFSSENKSRVHTFILPANALGVQVYTAKISTTIEEKNTRNNTKEFAIEVIDQRNKILLVPGIVHPDLGALKKAISSDKQQQVDLKKLNEIESLIDYQLVILYQPNRTFSALYKQLKKLKIPVLTIAGTATDYLFLNKIQTDFMKKNTRQEEFYLPVLNPDFTIFQVKDIGFSDLPPLHDSFGKLTFSGAMQPILWKAVQGIQTASPMLLCSKTDQDLKRAYLFGEGIWKWRAATFQREGSFEVFDNFIGKLIQYVSTKNKRKRLLLDYASIYKKGENILLKADYFDANYVFDPAASLVLKIRKKGEKEIENRPFLLKNNAYEVNLNDLSPGSYVFTAQVKKTEIESSGTFTILDYAAEQQFVNANYKGIKQIANQGKVYGLGEAQSLIDQLVSSKQFMPIQKITKKKSPLIDWYYLLIFIILTLSAEWFLRKYRGLI